MEVNTEQSGVDMKVNEILEFQENAAINSMVEEFQSKLDALRDNGFEETVFAQTETFIPGAGLLGIEVARRPADYLNPASLHVDLYTKENGEWVICHRHDTGDKVGVKWQVWMAISEYRESVKREERNEKKRKYRKGDPITSVNELLDQEMVYWRDKITPRGWFLSWQLKMAYDAINRGEIYKAIRKGETDA